MEFEVALGTALKKPTEQLLHVALVRAPSTALHVPGGHGEQPAPVTTLRWKPAGHGICVGVCVSVRVGVPVCVSVRVGVPVRVSVPVGVGVCVSVRVPVSVCEQVALAVGVGEPVAVAVGVPEALREGDCEAVLEALSEPVGVKEVDVGDGERVGLTVRMDWAIGHKMSAKTTSRGTPARPPMRKGVTN